MNTLFYIGALILVALLSYVVGTEFPSKKVITPYVKEAEEKLKFQYEDQRRRLIKEKDFQYRLLEQDYAKLKLKYHNLIDTIKQKAKD